MQLMFALSSELLLTKHGKISLIVEFIQFSRFICFIKLCGENSWQQTTQFNAKHSKEVKVQQQSPLVFWWWT